MCIRNTSGQSDCDDSRDIWRLYLPIMPPPVSAETYDDSGVFPVLRETGVLCFS